MCLCSFWHVWYAERRDVVLGLDHWAGRMNNTIIGFGYGLYTRLNSRSVLAAMNIYHSPNLHATC